MSDQPKITAVDATTLFGWCTLHATLDTGERVKLFGFYIDELTIAEADLVGLTVEAARKVRHDRDVAYLQS